jgi:hypothetical protein
MANLSEDHIQKLRLTLQGGGWQQVMQPATHARAQEAIKALCLNVEERKRAAGVFKDLSDDELRVTIRECEWHLTVWGNELKVFDFNKAQEQQHQNQENGMEYSRFGPLTGQPEGKD